MVEEEPYPVRFATPDDVLWVEELQSKHFRQRALPQVYHRRSGFTIEMPVSGICMGTTSFKSWIVLR